MYKGAFISDEHTSVYNRTNVVAGVVRKRHSGQVLNAFSIIGRNGNFGETEYTISKFWITGMAEI